MMGDKAFVDTNILLRGSIPRMNQHHAAKALIERMWRNGVDLWISRQVIREFLVQTTNPMTLQPPLNIAQIMERIRMMESLFRIADEDSAVTAQLIRLIQSHPTGGKQVHDANIIATMLANNIDTLLTLNVADMRRFESMIRLVTLE
jgi:predicted nucleic acid-binding protein